MTDQAKDGAAGFPVASPLGSARAGGPAFLDTLLPLGMAAALQGSLLPVYCLILARRFRPPSFRWCLKQICSEPEILLRSACRELSCGLEVGGVLGLRDLSFGGKRRDAILQTSVMHVGFVQLFVLRSIQIFFSVIEKLEKEKERRHNIPYVNREIVIAARARSKISPTSSKKYVNAKPSPT